MHHRDMGNTEKEFCLGKKRRPSVTGVLSKVDIVSHGQLQMATCY